VTFIRDLDEVLPSVVASLLAAAAIAFLLTPYVRHQVVRLGMLDRPHPRRVNTRPVPRGGGLAVSAAFLVIAAGFTGLNAALEFAPVPLLLDSSELVALFVGGAAAAALGAIDDYFDLRARSQLVGQVALALGAVALGIAIGSIQNPFGPGPFRFEGLAAGFLTVVWIVGMVNSVNFVDGLDGLSSGIGIIAAITLGVLSLTTQAAQPYVAILCFALAGALAGFLRWNFHPASIFAGTSGTMFLGYTLAVLAILGSAKVVVALLVLGIPIIDTFWIIVRRVLAGRSPFTPDRGHLHHRLLDLGLSHRQAVVLIYAICAGLGVLSLLLSETNQVYAFLGVLVAIGLVLLILARGGLASEALGAETYESEPPRRS
jgi:UDP-GlcNAc:undecaprenyl-phosphate GlcNAc-1-phosphate transferase